MDASPLGSNRVAFGRVWIGALATIGVLSVASGAVAATINGQVVGGGAPIANSTVFQPLRKEVTDFKISPFGLTPFYGVGINK